MSDNTTDGKLLVIEHENKILSLLIGENKLLSVRVYSSEGSSQVGNIYIGKITGIPAGLGAAFVDIKPGVSCFLPLCDTENALRINDKSPDRPLRAGDELLVQIARDAVKTKQPVVSGHISIAGNYLATAADTEKVCFSAKLPSLRKKELRALLLENGLISEDGRCLSGCGMIVRTNAGSLQEDMAPLLAEWKQLSGRMNTLLDAARHRSCYSCLFKADTPYVEELKNYYSGAFDEIITDSEELYRELCNYEKGQESAHMPFHPVRLYRDDYPLSKLYQLKTRLENALGSRVWLKSGAYLIIEPTEALTVIDVNSGKNERRKNNADYIFSINKEAAEEVMHQLRVRNLSGIIVVDFINMEAEEQKEALLHHMRMLCKEDPVKTTVVDITPLGLVEITRKRTSRPLRELLSAQDIDFDF